MAKFSVIVKVHSDGVDRFLKYRKVTNVDRFISFLNAKHPTWKWLNIYDTVTGEQVDNRTKRSK